MTAFEQGYDAFLKGEAEDTNPFNKETSPNSLKRWAEGWARARSDRVRRAR